MIKIEVHDIIERLEGIRERVGGVKDHFTIVAVDSKIAESGEIKAYVHPSNFLFKDDSPFIIYIRDHSNVPAEKTPPEGEGNRIHVANCEKIIEMTKSGKRDRYHATNRDGNIYPIDVRGGETRYARLLPCLLCLEILYPKSKYPDAYRYREKSNFDVKKTFRLISEMIDIHRLNTSGLRGADIPTGYSWGHSRFSAQYRKYKNYTCDICEVNLSSKRDLRGLVDMHHKSGNQGDNRFDNLQCLCKLCHQETHKQTHHYHVNAGHAAEIRKARKEQGIIWPPRENHKHHRR